MDSDGEYEEQEVMVYLEFNSKIDDELLSLENEFKLIGLDSDKPVLQMANQVFEGEWRDSLGTQVFFDDDDNPPTYLDPVFNEMPPMLLKHSCQTDKILHMSRIFVNKKKEPRANEGT